MDTPNVIDLILRWQELRRQGREATPEEICADCPEKLNELRERLRDLAKLTGAESEKATQDARTVDFTPPPSEAGQGPDAGTAHAKPASKKRPLPAVPGYEILEELGRGGMGIVYKARDLQLKRLVALKMILGGGHANPEMIERFRAEAKAVARLQHPNIVQIYEIGEHEGLPFFSLEFVNGGALNTYLAGMPQAPRDAATLVGTLARAMQVAHEAGIVHRDLKPANILLARSSRAVGEEAGASTPGSSVSGATSVTVPENLQTVVPKVSDFGLAKQLDDQEGRTVSGAIMGTPSYMAPEQALGRLKQIGPVTDVYALGAILYEVLTGRPPFRGASSWETLDMVRTQDPVPPRQMQPNLPRDLETICLKCLHKEPLRRYANATELADDLQRFLNNEPVLARPVSNAERMWRWCQRWPAQAALVLGSAVAALLLIGGAFWFTIQLGNADARALKAKLDQERAESLGKEQDLKRQQEEEKRQQAEKLAATHAFYRWFNGAREKRQENEAGWTWRNLADLTKVLKEYPEARKLSEVHTEVIATLASVDARLRLEVAKDFKAAPVAFSPDGKTLALGQERVPAYGALGDCQVLLVDPVTGKLQKTLTFPPSQVWQFAAGKQDGARGIAFGPDGAWLVIGSRSGLIHRWNLHDQKPKVHSWQAHQKEVHQLTFDRSGTALFSIAENDSLCRWRINDGKLEASFKDKRLASDFAYDPISDHVMVASEGFARILDGEHLFEVRKLTPFRWNCVAYAAAGRVLVHNKGRSVEFHDLLSDRAVRALQLPNKQVTQEGDITAIRLSPDGTLLAVSSMDTRHLQVWDLLSGRLAADVVTGAGRLELAFSPDGQTLAVTGEKSTWLYELRGPRECARCAPSVFPVDDLMLSGNGQVFACRDEREFDCGYSVWPVPGVVEPEPTRPYRTFRRHGPFAKQSALNEDGSGLAFRFARNLLLWKHVNEEAVVRDLDQQMTRFGPDQRLWTALSGIVRVWQGPELKEQAKWDNSLSHVLSGKGNVTSLLPGSRWALAGARDGVLHVLEAKAARAQRSVILSRTPLTSVALSADESTAAVGTEAGEIVLVRLPRCEITAQAKQTEEITGLHFLRPDLLISASNDRTLRLWHISGKGLTETLRVPCPGMVRQLRVTPDGRQWLIMVAGEYGIRSWHVDSLRARLTELGLEVELPLPTERKSKSPPPANPYELPDGPGLIREDFVGEDLRYWTNIQLDSQVSESWRPKEPCLHVGGENFSLRWKGWLKAARAGKYLLELEADDGARLWLDDKLVMDQWPKGGPLSQVEVELTEQPHRFRVDYAQTRGKAYCHLRWAAKTAENPAKLEPVPASAFFTSRAAATVGKKKS